MRTSDVVNHEPRECAVCGTRDARALVPIELRTGIRTTLCGTHALMHSRDGSGCRNVAELRETLADRRATARRAPFGGDELAEQLAAAFTRERRATERRAG